MGLEPDEALLPQAPESFDGYRLLQEYYAMPERLLFVELGGLDRAAIRTAGTELDVLLLLNRSEPRHCRAGFGVDHMALFCTPAVNLFPRAATASTCPSARPSIWSCPTACGRWTSRCSR